MTRCRPLPVVLLLASAALAQDKAPSPYPERDILSPFRACSEIYAPPDAVFAQLRILRDIAEDASVHKDFDAQGIEVADHPRWRQARAELKQLGLDAGVLAVVMRTSRNDDDRALAFYGTFFCSEPNDIFNLIGHIPGEPVQRTREQTYPRAIAYLRAHIGRRYGDLTDEQKKAIQMPEVGSPAAKAAGITRAPRNDDYLFSVNLKPFFQLLDLDSPSDQAQGLWFLKETALARSDLASAWLEPALPRIRQLLATGDKTVRGEAVGLFLAIAPKGFKPAAAGDDAAQLLQWSDQAARTMFPPIRNLGDGVVMILPGEDRDAIVAAGRTALAQDSIGEKASGTAEDGKTFFGWRVGRVPDSLKVLKIPVGAVITSVNGNAVNNSPSLLAAIEKQFAPVKDRKGNLLPRKQSVIVEFMFEGKPKAMEYRLP